MKITDIQVSTHIVPCDPPYPAAWDSIPRATLPTTIVRVQTDTGLEGFASGDPCYGIEDLNSPASTTPLICFFEKQYSLTLTLAIVSGFGSIC